MPIRARCSFVRFTCVAVFLFASTRSFAQPICATFNSGTLENWTTANTSSSTIKTRGPGDFYIELKDGSGPSTLSAPASLLGNLADKLGCGELCFEVNLFKNGSDAPPTLHASISLGSGSATATFSASQVISAGSGWKKVCAPVNLTSPNTGPPTSPNGTWTVNPAGAWNSLITNVNSLKLPVDYGSSSQDEIVGYDNICFNPGTCVKAEAGCCPGPNLIQNGNFEAGNSGFNSSYLYMSNPNFAGGVPPGRYSVLDSTQASTVASTWNVKSYSTCSATGKFLAANGATGQTGSKKVWAETVGVVPGKEYRFCANLRNMPQCAFDVKPKVELRFSSPANTTAPSVISANPSNACDWVLESRSIQIPGGTTSLTSEIWLDETGLGDGNDLALDGISLQEMTPANASYVLLNIASSNITATTYNITATPAGGQPYSYYWEVCEVDSNGNCIATTRVSNPSQWWVPGPNNFKGYVGTSSLVTTNPAPGAFQTQKRYQIKYGVFGQCVSWTESRWYFGFSHSAKKVVVKNSVKELALAVN